MKWIVYSILLGIASSCNSSKQHLVHMSGHSSIADTTHTAVWDTLSNEQYSICHDKKTEPPFSGKYDNFYEKGTYHCVVCNMALFSSETKFKSGTGWPSFYNEINNNVSTVADSSYHMIRDEIVCSKCGSHLGHVFDDGPKPTGMRYCVNSLSLKFVPNLNK